MLVIKKTKCKIGGSVELHMRSLNNTKYSFCGPGTNLDKRLKPDGSPQEWSTPINKVDSVCMQHDKKLCFS
jgi:hypothetical protein